MDGIELRPEVRAFAEAMELKLRRNDHKGGWKEMPASWLLDRLVEEIDEYKKANTVFTKVVSEWLDQKATKDDVRATRPAILTECVDIANYAMMIASVCGALRGDTDAKK